MGKVVCVESAPEVEICNALGPLRDIVQSLAEAETGRIPAGPARKKVLRRLQTAGNAAVPTLVRSLASPNESVSSWAYFLLARLGSQRVVRKVSQLLEDPEIGDDVKVRALGLLSDLQAPVPPAVKLRDPDGLLEKSVRELVESLERDDDVSQAVELIIEQVPEAELPAFCGEVVKHGGDKARGLLDALCEHRTLEPDTVRALAELAQQIGRPPVDADTNAALERGLEYLEAGKPRAARRRLERFVATHPMHAEGRSALGVCLLQLDAFDLAFGHLHEAARLEPDEPLHRWNLAAAAKQAERLGGAYLALREYLTLADDGDGALERRAEARSFVRAYERMLRDSHPGVSLNDYLRGEELFARAYASLSEGRPAEAVRGFEAVLALVPRHYPSWGNLGAAYLQLDRKTEAQRCLEHALELNPDYAVARKNLALLTPA